MGTVALDAALVRNLTEAFITADQHAATRGLDRMAVRDRLAFALVTEAGGGYIYANDGRNTSNSPSVTPAVEKELRRSLDPEWLAANDLHYDRIGSNGRSTGPLQQISKDVGGGWGDMAGTMRMSISSQRFLDELRITDNPIYAGRLVQTDGSTKAVNIQTPDAIVADVLRVQRPLANEAASTNYGKTNLARAQAIARDDRFTPTALAESGTPPQLSGDNDMPIVLQSSGEPRPHLLLSGARATLLKDGASTDALRKAGIPVAQVATADWDNIRNLWEVQPIHVTGS